MARKLIDLDLLTAVASFIWILLIVAAGIDTLNVIATPELAAIALTGSLARYVSRTRLPTPSEDSPWWRYIVDIDLLGAVVTGTWAIVVVAADLDAFAVLIPVEGAAAWALAALVRYGAKWQAVIGGDTELT